MNDPNLLEAERLWTSGKTWEAGEILFARIPEPDRPAWAARCLRLAVEYSGATLKIIQDVLNLAESRKRWKYGHDVFDKVRTQTLSMDEKSRSRTLSQSEQKELWLLEIAELVAKISYNATDPYDPFDDDTGHRMAQHLHAYSEFIGANFRQKAWQTLSQT